MNLLAKAAGYLQGRMIESASEPVRYIRAGAVYQMRAVVGQLVTDQTDVNGFVLRTVTRDFTISQSAFAWSDDNKPKRNDEIWQLVDGYWHVFTVNGDSFATAHYEESDAYGVAFRIHTRKDREVAA